MDIGQVGSPLTVLVVADDEAIRDLLEAILDLDSRFTLAGAAATGPDAVEMACRLQPAVVVVDLQIGGSDWPGVLGAIRRRLPGANVVVLSAIPDPYTLLEVLTLGADAYLDEANAFSELVPTLMAVCGAELESRVA